MMSTNSIIAAPVSAIFGFNAPHDDFSWAGRFCHWDGYPSHMGRQLWAIVQRDKVAKARNVLLIEWTAWSTIDSDEAPPVFPKAHPEYPKTVEGYGRGQAVDNIWIKSSQQDKGGTEWVYLLGDDAMHVGVVSPTGSVEFEPLWIFPWDDPEPDWHRLEHEVTPLA